MTDTYVSPMKLQEMWTPQKGLSAFSLSTYNSKTGEQTQRGTFYASGIKEAKKIAQAWLYQNLLPDHKIAGVIPR